MLDQTALGHAFLHNEFGVTPRVGWQLDPFGHSAVQASHLGTGVGFEAVFFGRADQDDVDERSKSGGRSSRYKTPATSSIAFYTRVSCHGWRIMTCRF